MIPPVSVCHQLSRNGTPRTSAPPRHRLRVERLADRRGDAQPREIVAARQLGPRLHQHADRRRRGVPDRDALALEHLVPVLGDEVRLVDDTRDAVREGAIRPYDVPVTQPGPPCTRTRRRAGGRAPCARRVVGDDRAVHVHRSFRSPRRSAREVQEASVSGGVGASASSAGAASTSAFQSRVPAGMPGPSSITMT